MKLEELGKVYLNSVEGIEDVIERKKRELKAANKNGNLALALSLKHDLRVLREMKHECTETGYKLKNYYAEEGRRTYRQHRIYK